MSWQQIVNEIKRDLQVQDKLIFEQLQYPVLINRYKREYYESSDGICRLTLDYDFKVFNQLIHSYPNLKKSEPIKDFLVLEVKIPRSQEDHLEQIINPFPFRMTKGSKYVHGLKTILSL